MSPQMGKVAAGMTSVMQVTDTDFTFIMKAAARDEKTKLVLEMKQKAQVEGGVFSAPNEMVRIAHAGHKEMVAQNEEHNLVLAAMRRNRFLHCRPDGEVKLVLSELQDGVVPLKSDGEEKLVLSELQD